jgi:hypothetical protein
MNIKWILLLFFECITCLGYSHSSSNQPYVTATIHGRLGNNLFQVATASALAWDNNAEVSFPDFASPSIVYDRVFFRCKRDKPSREVKFYWNEPSYAYQPIPFHPDMHLYGYFQSEKYFSHHRERLLELFAPHPQDLEYMQEKYDWLFRHPNTVGVQIRHYKSEYPALPEGLYPQYGKDYLEKAMMCFPESTLFIVTSDNMEFAKKNIPASMKNVVFIENEPHYIAFYLLSFCKHNIITNSSFGWWGAWLNNNPDKVVIRPHKVISGLPTEDVYPESWIEIEAFYE